MGETLSFSGVTLPKRKRGRKEWGALRKQFAGKRESAKKFREGMDI